MFTSELFRGRLLWMLKKRQGQQTYFSLVFHLLHPRHSSLTASWADAETLCFKLPRSPPAHASSRFTRLSNYCLIRMEQDWRWRPSRQIPLTPDAILACFDHVTPLETEVRKRHVLFPRLTTRGHGGSLYVWPVTVGVCLHLDERF